MHLPWSGWGNMHSSHMEMRIFLSLSLVLLLAGCGSGDKTRPDQHGLITYQIPEGWEPVPASGETRFRPTDGLIKAEIQVSTIPLDKPRNLHAERDQWLSMQEMQGNAILLSEGYMNNGFDGVAYAHETETSMGTSIQHSIQLQAPGVLVSTYLMVAEDHYEELRPVYQAIVDTIRPAGTNGW
jgi:hypothetical protein